MAALIIAIPAQAAVYSGTAVIAASVSFSATSIDFLPSGSGNGFSFLPSSGQTGSFLGLQDTTGTAADIFNPSVGAANISDFLRFAAEPTLRFSLTEILTGTHNSASCAAPVAAGQVCTPSAPWNYFSLTNLTSSSAHVSFTVRGFVSDGSGDRASPYVGSFLALLPDNTYQDFLAALNTGDSMQASIVGTFVVSQAESVPEPGTAWLLAAGALALALGSSGGVSLNLRGRRS